MIFFYNLCLVDIKDVKNVLKIGILFVFISLKIFIVLIKYYYQLLLDCFEGYFICFFFIYFYVIVMEGYYIWEVFILV